MTLQDYLRILRRGWLLTFVLLLAGTAAAAGFTLLQTPKYVATTRVFVSTSSASTVTDLGSGTSYSQQIARSFAEIVSTSLILEPVIEELGLDRTTSALSKQVSATAQLNTVLLDISVTDADPELAAEIANAVTASLIETVPELAPATSESGSPVRVTVAQPAGVPAAPSSPNVPLFLIVGALVGLGLGVGISFLREVLDNRIRGEHDVRSITDAPILGGIVYDGKAKDRPLIVHADPRSPRAESFRTLRTNLQFIDFAEPSRTFIFTSSMAGEGKSTTAANLAITLAAAGQSVMLIEGDLRRPKLAEYLGIETAAGLTDVLIGRAKIGDVVHQWGQNNLYVLPAGQIPPNPSELLGSAAMKTLLESLEADFGIILIDTPPLLPVTDAAILSKMASGAIIIVAAGRTHRAQLEASVAALHRVGATLHGVVLTMLPTSGPDAYGQYSYGQYGQYASDTAAP